MGQVFRGVGAPPKFSSLFAGSVAQEKGLTAKSRTNQCNNIAFDIEVRNHKRHPLQCQSSSWIWRDANGEKEGKINNSYIRFNHFHTWKFCWWCAFVARTLWAQLKSKVHPSICMNMTLPLHMMRDKIYIYIYIVTTIDWNINTHKKMRVQDAMEAHQ